MSAARLAAVTAVAPAVWGTTYLVTTELLPAGHPLWLGAIRALPAGMLALAIMRRLPQGAWWWRSAVLGTLNIGAFFALLFMAAYRLPGGVAATVGAVQPLLVAGLAVLLIAERPTRWRLGWALAGVAGVGLMVLRADAGLDTVGLLAALAGTASMATGIVLGKRWGTPVIDGRPVGALTLTAWQLVSGGGLLAVLAIAVEGGPPALTGQALAGYAWLGLVGTLGGYAVWFRGLSRLPVSAAAFLPLVSPAVATLLGWVALGEGLGAIQLAGFVLAMVAVVAAQRPRASVKRPRTSVQRPAASANRRQPVERAERAHAERIACDFA